jgi:hypothetical protein
MTAGRPGDRNAKRTKDCVVGRSYSVALSSDFSQELKPYNTKPTVIKFNKYFFIQYII